jgi:hypothetical protein
MATNRFCGFGVGVFALGTLLFLVTSLTPAGFAQTSSTGAIKGTVTDASGAVVPNATVEVTNAGTGVSRSATTQGDGSYVVSLLPLGTYRIQVQAAGSSQWRFPPSRSTSQRPLC